ncbi:hypothetical protein Ae150APs1_6096 [Pseudonocardia sp. Ae150A_Ps1]|nr:hypothetical protein Ae150APs1_6096 [Pseudonocardia sp. Ae150A_Ps1]
MAACGRGWVSAFSMTSRLGWGVGTAGGRVGR